MRLWCSPRRWPCGATNHDRIHWNCARITHLILGKMAVFWYDGTACFLPLDSNRFGQYGLSRNSRQKRSTVALRNSVGGAAAAMLWNHDCVAHPSLCAQCARCRCCPCMNGPFKCKMPGCNMYAWTYSMKTHYADNHQGAGMSEDMKNQVLLKPHERTYVNRLVVAYTKGIKTMYPTLLKAITNKEATYTCVLECDQE